MRLLLHLSVSYPALLVTLSLSFEDSVLSLSSGTTAVFTEKIAWTNFEFFYIMGDDDDKGWLIDFNDEWLISMMMIGPRITTVMTRTAASNLFERRQYLILSSLFLMIAGRNVRHRFISLSHRME